MENGIKILLVDDHPILRSGLRALFSSEADMCVVGEVSTGREAVAAATQLEPHVVIMDLRMPELNGIDAARQVLAACPRVKVIGLSANSDERSVLDMLRAGAVGFVKKESAYEELLTAVRTVMNNNIFCSTTVLNRLVKDRAGGFRGESAFDTLSNRERETLQLIAEGKSTKEIAAKLEMSIKTAETHRRNLMEKLNADSVAELTKCAIRGGLTGL